MVLIRIKDISLNEAAKPVDIINLTKEFEIDRYKHNPEMQFATGKKARKPNDELEFWGSYFRRELKSEIDDSKEEIAKASSFGGIYQSEVLKSNLEKIVFKYIKYANLSNHEEFLKLSSEKHQLLAIDRNLSNKKEKLVKELDKLLSKFENPKFDPNDKYNKEPGALQAKWSSEEIPDDIKLQARNIQFKINEIEKQQTLNSENLQSLSQNLETLKPDIEKPLFDFTSRMAGGVPFLLKKNEKAPRKEKISLFYDLLMRYDPFWIDYFTIKENNVQVRGSEIIDTIAQNITKFIDGQYKKLSISIDEFDREEQGVELYNTHIESLRSQGYSEKDVEKISLQIQKNIEKMSLEDVASTVRFFKEKNYNVLAKILDTESRNIFLDTFQAVNRLQDFIDNNKAQVQEILTKFYQKNIQYKNNEPAFTHNFDAVGLKVLSENDRELFKRIPPASKPFEELDQFVKLSNAVSNKKNINTQLFYKPALAFVALYRIFSEGHNDLSSIMTNETFTKSDWGISLVDDIKRDLPPVPVDNIKQILELKRFILDDVDIESDTELLTAEGEAREFSIVPKTKSDKYKIGKRAYLEKLLEDKAESFAEELFNPYWKLQREIKSLNKEDKKEEAAGLQGDLAKIFDNIFTTLRPVVLDYMAQRNLDTTLIETQNLLYGLLKEYEKLLRKYNIQKHGSDVIKYLVDGFEEYKDTKGQRFYIGPKRLWAIPTSDTAMKSMFDEYVNLVSVSKTKRFDIINREDPYGTQLPKPKTQEISIKPGARDVRSKKIVKGEEIPHYQSGREIEKDAAIKDYIPTQDAVGVYKRVYDNSGSFDRKKNIITYQITQEDVDSKRVFKIPVDKIIPIFATITPYKKNRVQYEAFPAESIIKDPKAARKAIQSSIKKQFDTLVRRLREVGGVANRYFATDKDLGRTIRIKKDGKTVNHIINQNDINNKTSFSLDLVVQPTVHVPIKEKFIPTESDLGKEVVVYETKKFKAADGRIRNKFIAKRHEITKEDIKNKKVFYVPQKHEKTYTKTLKTVPDEREVGGKFVPEKTNKKAFFAELLMISSSLMRRLNITADEIWDEIKNNVQSILASLTNKYPKKAEIVLKEILKEMISGNYNKIFDILYRDTSEDPASRKIAKEYADFVVIQVIDKCILIAKRGMNELDEKFKQMDLRRLGSSYANAIDSIQEQLMAGLMHHLATVRPFRKYMNERGGFEGGEKAIFSLRDQGDGPSIVHPNIRAMINPATGVKKRYATAAGHNMWQQSQDVNETKQTAFMVLMNVINRYAHRIKSGLPHYENLHKTLAMEIDRDIKRELRNNKFTMRFGNSSYTWGEIFHLHQKISQELGDVIIGENYYIQRPEWFEDETLRRRTLEFIRPILDSKYEKDKREAQKLAPRGVAVGSEDDKKHKVKKGTRSTKKLGGAHAGTSPEFKGDTSKDIQMWVSGKVGEDARQSYINFKVQEFENLYPQYLKMLSEETLELDRPFDVTEDGDSVNLGDMIESLSYAETSLFYEYIQIFDATLSKCFSKVSANYGKLSKTETEQLNSILIGIKKDVNNNPDYAKEYMDNMLKNISNEDFKKIIAYKFFEYFYIKEFLFVKLFAAAVSAFKDGSPSNDEVRQYLTSGFNNLIHKPTIIFDSAQEDFFNLNPMYIYTKFFRGYMSLLNEETLEEIISYICQNSDFGAESDAKEFGKAFAAYKQTPGGTQGATQLGDVTVSPSESSRISKIDKSTLGNLGFQNLFLKLKSKTLENMQAAKEKIKSFEDVSRKEFMEAVNFIDEVSKRLISIRARNQNPVSDEEILDTISDLKYAIPVIKRYILSDDELPSQKSKDPLRGIETVSDKEQEQLLNNLNYIIKKTSEEKRFDEKLYNEFIQISRKIIETLDKLGELPKNYRAKVPKAKTGAAKNKKEDLIKELSNLQNLEDQEIKSKLLENSRTLGEILKVAKLNNSQKSTLTRAYQGLVSLFEKEKNSDNFKLKVEEFKQQLQKVEIKLGDKTPKTVETTDKEETKPKEATGYKKGMTRAPNKIKESVDPNFNILVNKLIGIVSSNAAPTGVLRFKTKDLKNSNNDESEEKRKIRLKSLASFMIRLQNAGGDKIDKYTIYSNPEIFTKDYIITEPDLESDNKNDFITYVVPKHIVSR